MQRLRQSKWWFSSETAKGYANIKRPVLIQQSRVCAAEAKARRESLVRTVPENLPLGMLL